MKRDCLNRNYPRNNSASKQLGEKEILQEGFKEEKGMNRSMKRRNVRILALCGAVLLAAITVLVFVKHLPHDKQTFDYKLIPVQSGEKWGFIDHKGRYVVNPQFSECSLFSNGLAMVRTSNNKVGYINYFKIV